jgi:molybdopterin/thiamine biosynthesis adenylyltransferase
VGELVLVDPDVTSDDNLNRQLLADEENLGRPKVDAAAVRLGAVNSATRVTAFRLRGDADSFSRVFQGAAVVVDCLDSIPARFALEDAARSLGVPLVHGAVGGFAGHVTCVFPGDPGLEALYGPRAEAAAQGVESVVGTPSPTPAVVAALEVTEVLKIIAGVGEPLRRKLLTFDTASPYFAVVEL